MTIIDQKVRERLLLMSLIHGASRGCHNSSDDERIADAILQSPDLRVTLVEPRYFLASSSAGSYLRERIGDTLDWNNVAFFYDADKCFAKDYCDWLNSKEPHD